MFAYRNTRTKQIVTFDEPNHRLERLPVWESVSADLAVVDVQPHYASAPAIAAQPATLEADNTSPLAVGPGIPPQPAILEGDKDADVDLVPVYGRTVTPDEGDEGDDGTSDENDDADVNTTVDVPEDLEALTRAQLNQLAEQLLIEEPAKLANKGAVVDAIAAAVAASIEQVGGDAA